MIDGVLDYCPKPYKREPVRRKCPIVMVFGVRDSTHLFAMFSDNLTVSVAALLAEIRALETDDTIER